MRRSEVSSAHATMRDVRLEGELCGFRVLRRIHTGERTHAFLARDLHDDHVVLRVFPGPDGPARARDELDLSSRAPRAHLQLARDVGVNSTGEPVLVCERLGSRLSQQLEGGGHIAAGSVVTLAAPLATTLRALHDSGSTHGAVDVAHVRLASDGRPVLVGADGGLPATPSSIRADLEGLAHLITAALEHSDESSRSRALSDVTGWLHNQLSRDGKPSADLYADLECRIFALAEPLPFAVGQEPEPTGHRNVARRSASLRERGQDSTLSRLLEGEVSFSLPVLVTPLRHLFSAFARTTRRRRLTLVAVLVFLASVAGALWLIPPSSSADESPQTTPQSTSITMPAASTSLTPVDALTELLAVRSTCRERTASAQCLASVYEPMSPALSAETAAAELGKTDPFPVLSLDKAKRTLDAQSETGGAVIVVVTSVHNADTNKPVSVLLVKTETGWLIRDVFDA
ncbi:hypothetical protein [Paramicrobacterium chengjingii]|uniref:Protein kinase domain-containing protein n=1 Tax=Paramicrobacterium chengjingii TaxID=2769067 RepID=A0ABX6YNC0_9MICO|nr:hypothetical protein [Microbacterium chengjingii]QPZ40054.1 hypothetical protein HCR76_08610 [Microbacterium chengjingii]